MSKSSRVAFALLALVMASACSSPNAPGAGKPAPGPSSMVVTFRYVPPEPCRSEPSHSFCNRSKTNVSLDTLGWPDGYIGYGIMVPQSDGSLELQVSTPFSDQAGTLRVQVLDPWLCPAGQSICRDNATGKGLSVNGVRLRDGDAETAFVLERPDRIIPK